VYYLGLEISWLLSYYLVTYSKNVGDGFDPDGVGPMSHSLRSLVSRSCGSSIQKSCAFVEGPQDLPFPALARDLVNPIVSNSSGTNHPALERKRKGNKIIAFS
jgi:hypothetical protein